MRPAFEGLGATFVKLGQFVASADGMLPAAFVDEFKRCRDEVPPESWEHVRDVVEADLGRPLADVFERFDRVPLAAASIAQVHTARLRTGEEVVVKVQRPDIDRVVRADIATLAWLAPVIERRSPGAAVANLPAYIELFAETVVEELDFRLEAQNLLDVAAVLATVEGRPIVVPRPHPELVTRRVLVMERLHGHHIDDEAGLAEAGIDPAPVFRALMISFLEGALVHGVFHGDLHGGNLLIRTDGRPAVFDFGITGRFEERKRLALLGLMMTSVTQDPRAMLVHFRDLGGFPADADLERIAEELRLDELMTQSAAELSAEEMAVQMRDVMQRLVAHGARLPKELFLFVKVMVYLSGAISRMAADVDMLAEIGHLYGAFTAAAAGELAALDIDPAMLPAADEVADRMRQQMGLEGDSVTLRDVQEQQLARNEELRAVRRR
jgi:ubiquinone biosynthesis protein